MKSLSLALCLTYIVTACGNGKPVISAELEPMVRDFIIDCTKHGRSDCSVYGIDSIKLVDGITAAGVCTTQQVGTIKLKSIQVNRGYCMQNKLSCKAIVYHELGHCQLNQDHRENSIMAPMLYTEATYEQSWDKLVTKLFQWSK